MNEKHRGYRNCPNCGKEFEITTSTLSKIYCIEKCKRELNRERLHQLYIKKRGLDTKLKRIKIN